MERYTTGTQTVEVLEMVNEAGAFYLVMCQVAAWTGSCEPVGDEETEEVKGLFVDDLEGPTLAVFGDFIVRDKYGTVSVYKPEIFHQHFKKIT